MPQNQRKIFFLNGSKLNWQVGKTKSTWGLQLKGIDLSKAYAILQELGFAAGAEVLAISGPLVHFRAVVGSDDGIYFDDSQILWLGKNDEIYPIRFRLTDIKDIDKHWFRDLSRDACLSVLRDAYFNRRSLFLPNASFNNNPNVDIDVIFGHSTPYTEPLYLSPEKLEEDYRNKFAPQFRCDDGHLVRSLSEKEIDEWLYKRKISHAYEPLIPIPEPIIPDFKLSNSAGEDVYIEFWGMIDDPTYLNRMKRKSDIYAKYHLNLIEIRPGDLKNLDFILSQKLPKKGVKWSS